MSLGVIETNGFITAIQAADRACKAAEVTLIEYRRSGSGRVTLCFRGEVSAVKTAIETAVAAECDKSRIIGCLVIPRPEAGAVSSLSSLKGRSLTEEKKKPVVRAEKVAEVKIAVEKAVEKVEVATPAEVPVAENTVAPKEEVETGEQHAAESKQAASKTSDSQAASQTAQVVEKQRGKKKKPF